MVANNFVSRVNRVAAKIEKNTDNIVKKAALAVDQTLVLATPVDTGRARSNWIVSLGVGTSRTRMPFAPIKPGTDPSKFSETANTAAALADAKGVIEKRKEGQDIYISNNLEYIGELNRGTSPQAQPNYIGDGVRAAVEALGGARLLD